MLKKVIYLFLMLLIPYVNADIIWDKYGVTQIEFDQDSFSCQQSSQVTIPGRPYQAPPSQMVSGYYVAPSWSQQLAAIATSKPIVQLDENAFVNCMQSKGYKGRFK